MSSWRRESVVAGKFYPGSAEKLKATLTECLGTERGAGTPRAIVVPHAGYIYSGRIAGEAYRRIAPPARAIILCPNHTGEGKRISVWSRGSWETPLGDVAVDEAMAAKLLAALGEKEGDRDAHLYEHAIEVQLPFLQTLNPGVTIVPVVLGPLQLDDCTRVGRALAEVAGGALLVASTDMSHYISAELADKQDHLALASVEKLDARGLYTTVAENDISMCGFIPTTAVLEAATILGASRGELVAYGNSGDTTGDRSSVVGYASALIA